MCVCVCVCVYLRSTSPRTNPSRLHSMKDSPRIANFNEVSRQRYRYINIDINR